MTQNFEDGKNFGQLYLLKYAEYKKHTKRALPKNTGKPVDSMKAKNSFRS